MNFEGTVNIEASREEVWKFLTDPHQVGSCAPGLESLEIVTPDEEFLAVASMGLGSIKVKFTATVKWLEMDNLERAKLQVQAKAPGSSVEATSEMFLSDGDNGSTDLRWTADISIMGKIASLASRLMGSVTNKMTGEFFKCMKAKIEA